MIGEVPSELGRPKMLNKHMKTKHIIFSLAAVAYDIDIITKIHCMQRSDTECETYEMPHFGAHCVLPIFSFDIYHSLAGLYKSQVSSYWFLLIFHEVNFHAGL